MEHSAFDYDVDYDVVHLLPKIRRGGARGHLCNRTLSKRQNALYLFGQGAGRCPTFCPPLPEYIEGLNFVPTTSQNKVICEQLIQMQ